MPSLKSGLRNSSILENVDSRMRVGLKHVDDTDTILTDYKRRGSSLPATTSSISVRLLPSLRHSATDPNLWTNNTIPKDVIETDYLSQTNPSSESLHQTADNTFQKESRSTQKLDSKVDADVRRELQKAYLDWLGQRVVTRRGPGRQHPAEQRSNYNLLLNADLVDRIALDIVRMSEREPSGLSGCRLRTRIERQQSADMDLGCVRVDQDAEETFEIVLSLRECHKSPEKRRPTARLMGNVSSFLSNVFGSHHHHHHHHQQQQQQQQQNGGRDQRSIEVHVSDAYQLEKIKLKRVYDGRHDATKNVGLCSV